MRHNHFIRPQWLAPLSLALGVLLLPSCASQQKYDEAVDLAEHYQQQLLDTELAQAQLQAENKRLRSELTMSQVHALEAGGSDPALEARLADYERRLAALGKNPDAITRVDLEGGAYVYMVPDAVLFATGSADVGDDGRRALIDTVVAGIQGEAHGRIWVRGHTDSVPVAKASTLQKFPHGNLQLSTARAIEVAAILTDQGGLPREQVVIAGFGPYEPLVANDSPENRALNRRVEIYVSPAN